MEDIILDNRSTAASRRNGSVKLKVLGWGWYLYAVIVKSLIMALIISIDFCLFAKAGGYSVFSDGILLNSEVLHILISIFCVSTLIMFLLSFSEWLQNLMLAFVAGLFTVALINQFALFDKGSFLTYTAMLYLGNDAAKFVDGISYLVMGGIVAFFVLIYMRLSSRTGKMYLAGILALVNLWVLSVAYGHRNDNNNFINEYDTAAAGNESGKKFVSIFLANAASLNYLDEMKDPNAKDNSKIENLQKIMLGFFEKNNFELYANAYVEHEKAEDNQAEILNPFAGDKQSLTMPAHHRCCDWQFRPLPDKTDNLSANRFADVFKRSQYKVSAYQSRGLDMCHLYGENSLNRCLSKANMPGDIRIIPSTEKDKIKLLYAQWAHSAGLLDAPQISAAASYVTNMFDGRYNKMYVVNSLQALDLAAIDIAQDKGNGAYLIYIDMPADMFVYNEFCMIKPIQQWKDMHGEDSLQAKRDAYAEQYACLYGKMQGFIDVLDAAGLNKNTVIIVQGVSAVQDKKYKDSERGVLNFGAWNSVPMAIRDPLHPESGIKTAVCKVSNISEAYLFKKNSCEQFKGLALDENARTELNKALQEKTISEENIKNSLNFYEHWYTYWQKANSDETAKTEMPEEAPVVENEEAVQPLPETEENMTLPEVDNVMIEENKITEPEAVDEQKNQENLSDAEENEPAREEQPASEDNLTENQEKEPAASEKE